MNNLIYNGQYECEGHTVTFLVSLDNTCIIKEMFISGKKVTSNERTERLEIARELQTKLIKLGYDKIS